MLELEKESMECIVDGVFGIYVPQRFTEKFTAEEWGIDEEDFKCLEKGPTEEFYWETWDDVLADAAYTDKDGKVWRLEQDGDLFAYCSKEYS